MPKHTKKIATLIIITAIVAITYHLLKSEPEPQTSSISTFSEDCEFLRKVTGGEITFGEPTAGEFRYELYATTDGIEVWKCN